MKPRFVRLAELLLEKETVVREELEAIMSDKRLPRNPEKTSPDADDIVIAPEAPDA
jgi:hypothetical protein